LRYFSRFFMKLEPLPSFHFGMNTSGIVVYRLFS
jgi:hypothetical protein